MSVLLAGVLARSTRLSAASPPAALIPPAQIVVGNQLRNFPDWLTAYVEYASIGEAPARMHFWSGVSAIAGALRRRVWINMGHFQWFPNFYIVLVAPPGVVAKSTTSGIAMKLLKKVPGVTFGPDVATWPALVSSFAASNESFQIGDEWHAQCALTLESSEFGNLVNPQDREMIDLLVNLWDSKPGAFKKITKGNGVDNVENPWINLIACTTPAWIAGNFPEYVIGGGFVSRCIFVYAEDKEKQVAYPHLHLPSDFAEQGQRLVADLEHIATTLIGPYHLLPETIEWGEAWYANHSANRPLALDDDRFSSYLARKQTHLHKTALVLAAASRDELVITPEDLAMADTVISNIERDMPKVFARIGRSQQSVHAERFISYVLKRKIVPYTEGYQHVHTAFPDNRAFDGMVNGAVKAGYLEVINEKGLVYFRSKV